MSRELSDQPELLLDRYKILNRLGGGGGGEVFRAFDTRMGRAVAVKRIPADRHTAPRAVREAQTAALLNHPNIVTVHEYEQTENFHYLIMELLDGLLLSEAIRRVGWLSHDEAAAVGIQICRALETAHLNDIIHRDIKPDNIMLLRDGRLKVMDFGVARLKGASLTVKGDIVGTVAYMSPEQANGELVDEQSDLFSLGVVLYEMLTGVHPFAAEATRATIFKILNVNPVPLQQVDPSIPEGLDNAVMTALSKEPDDRFEAVIDLRYKLERCLKGADSPEQIVRDLVRKASELAEEPKAPRDLRTTLIDFIDAHFETVKRSGAASLIALPAYLTMYHLIGLHAGLSFLLSAALFATALLLPGPAWLISAGTIIGGVAAHSPALALTGLFFILGYWFIWVRKQPLSATFPYISLPLAWLGCPFVFPLAAGLWLRPGPAVAAAATGALLVQTWNLLSAVEITPAIPSGYSLWTEAAGVWSPLVIIKGLFEPFLVDPSLVWQPLAWGTAAGVAVALRQTGLPAAVGTFIGFALLFLFYQLLLPSISTAPSPANLMQSLSFSLIILLLMLAIHPARSNR